MRRARWKRKNASAGRSAPAQTSCRRRGKAGSPLRQSGTETPGPWGNLWPGEVRDTSSFSFRCRWPVVDESCSIGQATAPTPARAARSEAERAERGANQMRPCTPMTAAPSATGRQLQKSQKAQACPKASPNRSRHRYADPRRAEGHCTGARLAPFSFGPCTARFLFGQDRKENGGCIPLDQPPCGSRIPLAAVAAASPHPRGGCICPAIIMAAYTVAALRFPSPGGAANRAASSKPPRFIRRWRRFGDFPRPMGRLPKKGQGGQAPFSRNLLTASPAPAAPAPCRAGPTG